MPFLPQMCRGIKNRQLLFKSPDDFFIYFKEIAVGLT